MGNTTFATILANLSQSLGPVQSLLSGLAYLLGILFMMTAISKLKKIGDARTGSHSQEKMYAPIAYFIISALLIYLPTSVTALSNTTFGTSNVLQYTPFNNTTVYGSMGIIIQTAGLIWFIRGCVLIVHGSQPGPGAKEGRKGLLFLLAGVFAVNFQDTMGMLSSVINWLISATNLSTLQNIST